MKHALIKLREERRVLVDVYRDLKVGILIHEADRSMMLRQTRREIRETEMGIAILERADLAITEAVKPVPGSVKTPERAAERPAVHG